MIHIKNILVPVDFSEPSKKAVNYGLSLALQFKARLILAHIAPTTEVSILHLIPPEYLNKVEFETIVRIGDVRDELLNIVNDRNIDLVVMGSHGRPYIERLFLGSVTERMLRKLPVPVLTVSHVSDEQISAGPATLHHILYATDLSEGSDDGLQFSIRLAKGLDARLTVLHALGPMEQVFLGAEMAAYLPSYREEVRAQMQERLNKSVALASDGSVPITTALFDGVPYQMITQYAEKTKADLIVMNLQSKGRLERAFLGSTAERVIRSATVPVLSLPLPATYASRWAAA